MATDSIRSSSIRAQVAATFVGAICSPAPTLKVSRAFLSSFVEKAARRFVTEAGAPSAAQGRNQVTEEYRRQLEAQFGFDKPVARQYWDWLVVNKMGMGLPSYDYPNKTAWQLIKSRIPISLWFGLASFILTYLICIPLGIAKALKHRQAFDAGSSLIVFIAYAIPSFALAMVLKMAFCGTVEGLFDVFPLGGLASDFDVEPSFWTAAADRVWHMALPVACYVAGSFAMLTILMKNSLLDQISSDYALVGYCGFPVDSGLDCLE